MDNDGTIYSDTPGAAAPSSDLDYFQKKIHPGQAPAVRSESGWSAAETLSPREALDNHIASQIEESRKHDPERAQLILRQILDHELNRAIRPKPAVAM